MKKLFKKIINFGKSNLKKIKFLLSKNYKQFKKDKSQKFVLLDTPEHGNIGDIAIAISEREFILKHFPNISLFEFTHNECSQYLYSIKKYITCNDIVLIHGGGFIGSIWLNEHKLFIKLLQEFAQQHIIVFPQTIYFDKNNDILLEEFKNIVNNCVNLHLCTRDKNSHDMLRLLKVTCKCYYTPDIVLSYNFNQSTNIKNNKILLCLRKDKEQTINKEELINKVKTAGFDFSFTDTVIPQNICKTCREEIFHSKLAEFSQYSLIITDRLHGMIFSTLAETPCIAVDNLSKKVSGVYEWIKEVNFVKCVDASELNNELICKMMQLESPHYNPKALDKAFETIKNIIKGFTHEK